MVGQHISFAIRAFADRDNPASIARFTSGRIDADDDAIHFGQLS